MKLTSILRRFRFDILAVFAGISATALMTEVLAAAPNSLQFQGSVNYQLNGEIYKRKVETTRRFVARKDGEKWNIRSIDDTVLSDSKRPEAFVEFAHDGTNLFTLKQYDVEKSAAIEPSSANNKNFCHGVASVMASPVPPYSEDFIYFIWLALASGNYFLTNQDAMVPPPVHGGKPLRAEWRHSEREGFLERVQWFAADGTVQSRFRVLEWMSMGAAVVPKRFELVQFISLPNGDHVKAFRLEGNVFSTSDMSEESVLPRLKTRTLVTDTRRTIHALNPAFAFEEVPAEKPVWMPIRYPDVVYPEECK